MNYKLDILDRLKGQQPVIDNPEELTDRIMNSLPEQDAPAKEQRRRRLMPISWRWAASLLVLIACGAAMYFFSPEQPTNNIAQERKSASYGKSFRRLRKNIPPVTEKTLAKEGCKKMPPPPTLPREGEWSKVSPLPSGRSEGGLKGQRSRSSKAVANSSLFTLHSSLKPADPNVHYAHHPATTSEDTTYLAPSLVDDFIAKFANYYKVTPVALNCADDSTETRVASNAYVFPDKEEVNVIGRMLQMAVKYGNDAPGYGLSLSRDQFIFQLCDKRKHTKYLWLAERVRGYILLYATHAPIEAELSSACYQDFREKFTNTVRN